MYSFVLVLIIHGLLVQLEVGEHHYFNGPLFVHACLEKMVLVKLTKAIFGEKQGIWCTADLRCASVT